MDLNLRRRIYWWLEIDLDNEEEKTHRALKWARFDKLNLFLDWNLGIFLNNPSEKNNKTQKKSLTIPKVAIHSYFTLPKQNANNPNKNREILVNFDVADKKRTWGLIEDVDKTNCLPANRQQINFSRSPL